VGRARTTPRRPTAAEPDRLSLRTLRALERRIEVDLELGRRHSELVSELEALVTEHPLRERLRGQLITGIEFAGDPEIFEVHNIIKR
jgi:DNA-binding SARP family transcriptional activator